jgi:hypothetical protein
MIFIPNHHSYLYFDQRLSCVEVAEMEGSLQFAQKLLLLLLVLLFTFMVSAMGGKHEQFICPCPRYPDCCRAGANN